MDQMDYQYEVDLCRYCGVRPIDKSTGNPEEYLCKECREDKLKLKVPKWLIAALSVACVANVVMICYLTTKFSTYTVGSKAISAGYNVLFEAYELVDENKQWSALVKIQEYLESNPKNGDVALEGMRIAMNSGLYENAAYLLNTYLTDKGFTEEELNEINTYVDKLNRYFDTYDAIAEVMSKMQDLQSDMNKAQIDSAMDGMKKDLLRLEGNEAYEKEFIEYYVSFYFPYDARDAEERMKKAAKYLPLTAEACGRLAVVNRNRGDFEAAEEQINRGEVVNGEMTELLRAKATVYLAKGEYKKALSVMEELYNVSPEGLYVLDTYAVALFANNETERFDELMKSCEYDQFDEDFHKLIAGEISVRDYYVQEEK